MDMVMAFLFMGIPLPFSSFPNSPFTAFPSHGLTFDSIPFRSVGGSEKLWAPVPLTVILIYAKL